jgi:hypothetical protein
MMVEEVISLRASQSPHRGDSDGRGFRIGTEIHHTSVQAQTSRISPWWAALTVWGVVNAVNVLQSAGFFSRVITGNQEINHLLGYGIVALTIPAALALVAFVRARAGSLAVLDWSSGIPGVCCVHDCCGLHLAGGVSISDAL